MASLRAVIFDFDFTLADSSRGITKCVTLALTDLGLGAPSHERIVDTIGLALEEAFFEITGEANTSAAAAFSKRFHHHADDFMEANTTVYPSVNPVMRYLKGRGVRVGIVSTKRRQRIASILTTAGIESHFDVIVGAGEVAKPKPDPSGLLLAVELLHATRETVVYVGDHEVDALAATAAGVPFIATLSGRCSRNVFAKYPHRDIIDGVEQLPDALRI